jgi:hypothetical protein
MSRPVVIATITAYIITIIDSLKGVLGIQLCRLQVQIGAVGVDNLRKLISHQPVRV